MARIVLARSRSRPHQSSRRSPRIEKSRSPPRRDGRSRGFRDDSACGGGANDSRAYRYSRSNEARDDALREEESHRDSRKSSRRSPDYRSPHHHNNRSSSGGRRRRSLSSSRHRSDRSPRPQSRDRYRERRLSNSRQSDRDRGSRRSPSPRRRSERRDRRDRSAGSLDSGDSRGRRRSRGGSRDRDYDDERRRKREDDDDRGSWRGGRRSSREGRGGTHRDFRDRRAEEARTNIVVLRGVPKNASEDDVETEVRRLAISVGFSVPNVVRLHPDILDRVVVAPSNSSKRGKQLGDEDPNVTLAYVEFPSFDAAQTFVDACYQTLQIKGKRVRPEAARLYVSNLVTMPASDSCLEWMCVMCRNINRPRCPMCLQCRKERLADAPSFAAKETAEKPLGANLPYPDLSTFEMDRKSGYLYDHKLDLYFDPKSEYFISSSGVYYMKAATAEPMITPVHRLNNLGSAVPTAPNSESLSVSKSAPPLSEMPKLPLPLETRGGPLTPADFIKSNVKDEEAGEANGAESDLGPPQEDPSKKKATAIASVLAAAQYAAKASKLGVASRPSGAATSGSHSDVKDERYENDPLVKIEEGEGRNGVSETPSSTASSSRRGYQTNHTLHHHSEPQSSQRSSNSQNVRAIFEDHANDDTQDDAAAESLDQEKELSTATVVTTTEPPSSAAVASDDVEWICYVCLRRFKSNMLLDKHELESELHQKNSILQKVDRHQGTQYKNTYVF